MHINEFNRINDKVIAGTVVGMYPAHRFDVSEAFRITDTWEKDNTWHVTIVHDGEKVLFNVVAFLDEETGEVIGFL